MGEGNQKGPAWKKLNSKELGIKNSMIANPTVKVLNRLKKKGTYRSHFSPISFLSWVSGIMVLHYCFSYPFLLT